MPIKRCYMPGSGSGAATAPVTPPLSGLWQNAASGAHFLAPEVPLDTAYASRTVAETVAGPAYAGAYVFVTAELPEKMRITNVKVTMLASSGSGTLKTYLAANIRTVKASDLSTVATIFSGHGGGASAGAYAFTVRQLDVVTDAITAAGQHLVVEVGLYCDNAVATNQGGSLRVGDPTASTDAVLGVSGDQRGWIEFEYEPAGFPAFLGASPVDALYHGSNPAAALALGSTEL